MTPDPIRRPSQPGTATPGGGGDQRLLAAVGAELAHLQASATTGVLLWHPAPVTTATARAPVQHSVRGELHLAGRCRWLSHLNVLFAGGCCAQ